jgi:S-adenosylmethionine:diacylglycerol 3-amino-3-carboxypropyl transferase
VKFGDLGPSVKVGDLVLKRWGQIDVYQQDKLGIVVEDRWVDPHLNPGLSGYWILVAYPGRRPSAYRHREFVVVSSG